MEQQQTFDLIAQYKKLLDDKSPQRHPSSAKSPEREDQLQHARWMLNEMETGYRAGLFSEGKINRWLGFVQGIFWACGVYSIDTMREHNT